MREQQSLYEAPWGRQLSQGSFSFDHTGFYMTLNLSKKLFGLNGSCGLISSRKYGNRQLFCAKIWSNLYHKVCRILRLWLSHLSVWMCICSRGCWSVLDRVLTLMSVAMHIYIVFWSYQKKTLSKVGSREYPAYLLTSCGRTSTE